MGWHSASGFGFRARMRTLNMRKLLVLCWLVCLPLSARGFAQDGAAEAETSGATRDAVSLAERYLGYDGAPIVLPPTPIYEAGDVLNFWVSKRDGLTQVQAALAAAAPSIYLWVEDGIAYDASALNAFAAQLSGLYEQIQLRENYHEPLMLPGLGAVSDPSARMPVPDVDQDPHLYILYTTHLNTDRDVLYNPNDSLPAALVPDGISNEHEVLYIDTTLYADVPLHDSFYFRSLLTAMLQLILSADNPTQAPWLQEALNMSLRYQLSQSALAAEDAQAFLDVPDTSMTRLPDATNSAPTVYGQQLFLNYFGQRYGVAPFLSLIAQPGSGITPLDAALRQNDVNDPVTGAPVTGRDAFADFVVTNVLNAAFGDGRYVHTVTPLEDTQRPGVTLINSLGARITEQPVNQFGTLYLVYPASTAERVRFSFTGAETVARLPMTADENDTPFYWSGNGANADTTMTHAFDLREIDSAVAAPAATAATLTFESWHDLADGWSYGYVAVSTDGGATWIPLPTHSDTRGTTTDNPHHLAYGPAFTGISNPQGPRRFAFMGVLISDDGMTLASVTPGGPAYIAGLRSNDVVLGYDRQRWSETPSTSPNLVALLANYAPGDTVTLFVQRGTRRFDVPVVLGEHPTRVVEPQPLWLEQSVDLSPFAGQEILLRFEYVSLPGRENEGFAVRNIAIPALGFTDDEGWTLNGWQRITNTLPQQWLVQAITTGTGTTPPRVRPLIGVGDSATSGEWTFALQANEALIVTISGLNDDTMQPALFSAALSEG